jgi:hypothetical protein
MVTGTVVSVTGRQLVLECLDEQQVTLEVEPEVFVKLDGQPSSLEALLPGDIAECCEHADGTLVVLKVTGIPRQRELSPLEQALSTAEAHAERASEALSKLRKVEAELDTIKAEIVEYVLDGDDFDWVKAIVLIRDWKQIESETTEADAAEGAAESAAVETSG